MIKDFIIYQVSQREKWYEWRFWYFNIVF